MSDKAIITKLANAYEVQIVTNIGGWNRREYYYVDGLEVNNNVVDKLNKKMKEDKKMVIDNALLLSLTRQVLDLRAEKKRFNKDQNEQIKDLEAQIKKCVKE